MPRGRKNTVPIERKMTVHFYDRKFKLMLDRLYIDRFSELTKNDYYNELIIRGVQAMGGAAY